MITCEAEMTMSNLSIEKQSVYLGLGTNIGDREANLTEAIQRIKGLGLEIIRASSIYETEPVGYQDQPWFLNQVIEANMRAELTFNSNDDASEFSKAVSGSHRKPQILALLDALLGIEREMGRERTIANGPRVIDIDILFYGEYVGFFTNMRSAESASQAAQDDAAILILPHPRLHLRRFALAPLCEIAPDFTHPRLKKSCAQLFAALDDPSRVRKYRASD